MYILIVKHMIGDGDHEPCYVSFYESLEKIKGEVDKIVGYTENQDDEAGIEGEDSEEEDDEEVMEELGRSWYFAIVPMKFGFNVEDDMLSCFLNPKGDAEGKIYWASGVKYTFSGDRNAFAGWCRGME